MIILSLILLTLAFSQQNQWLKATPTQQQIHDVIIIGAGISGIASSKVLSEQGRSHLILQARDRIGGRIASSELDGVKLEIGASFVHNPLDKNAIDSIIQQMQWPIEPAKFYLIEEYYKSGKELNSDQTTKFVHLYRQFQTWSYGYLETLHHNVGLAVCWKEFEKKKKQIYNERILQRTYYQLLMEALTNGADLEQISAMHYQTDREKGINDYLPKGGYLQLLKAIFQKYCHKAQLKLNKVITEVDYSGPVIKVTTKDNETFYAKRVVSSLPLGVLKAGDITFIPRLPAEHQQAINNIGYGIYNKVIVSLSDFFWTKGMKLLDFIPLYSQSKTEKKFLQCYVVSQQNRNILMFFTGGYAAKELSHLSDREIVDQLITHIKKYINPVWANFKVNNFTVTRWEEDPYTKGSYSYYKVQTKKEHFKTLATPIQNRIFFVGQHTAQKQSSNVHGAFRSGLQGGAKVSASLFDASFKIKLVSMLMIISLTLIM